MCCVILHDALIALEDKKTKSTDDIAPFVFSPDALFSDIQLTRWLNLQGLQDIEETIPYIRFECILIEISGIHGIRFLRVVSPLALEG